MVYVRFRAKLSASSPEALTQHYARLGSDIVSGQKGKPRGMGKTGFNAAITACEKSCRWQKACQLLEDLESMQVEPTGITCNAVT